MMPESHKRKRATLKSLKDVSEAQSTVMERAKEVEASLDPKFPILLRVMLPSHVSGGFWLGLPMKFCRQHLPKQDTMIVLEDENGNEFQIKYLVGKVGLSGGWKWFAISHNLLEGDVVIFHIVTRTKFKVYIVRSKGLEEVDCALSLVPLDACIKQINAGAIVAYRKESLDPTPEDRALICVTESGQLSTVSEDDSEDHGFEVLGGLTLSEYISTFKEVKCIENFNSLVNRLTMNAEFPKHLLSEYFELCRSQNSFLHEHLVKGLDCKLVAGLISETINIADAIRTCKITTSERKFSNWEKTLEAFENLGMNVGFLRTRLVQLASLASEAKRFKEAPLEKDQAEEEMRSLEVKILEVKDTIGRLESEIETLNMSSEKLELLFQEVATTPW